MVAGPLLPGEGRVLSVAGGNPGEPPQRAREFVRQPPAQDHRGHGFRDTVSRQWIRRCSGPDAGPTASVGGYALAALRPRGVSGAASSLGPGTAITLPARRGSSARCSPRSGVRGGLTAGDALVAAPSPPGGSRGTPSSKRPGRRGSYNWRHQVGARPGAPGASPAGRRSSCVSFAAWVSSRGNPPFEASRAPRRPSARASAQLSPSQPAARPRHAAHLSPESGGASSRGMLLLRLLRRPGWSWGVPSSKRPGRRGSCSWHHQVCARRSPGHQEPRSQVGAAPPLQSTGARAPKLSAGSFSVSTAPRVQGSRIKGDAIRHQFPRGSPASTAILALGPRRPNGARLHYRSPHRDPGGTGRSRGWLARHCWVAKSW
ncbi:hypothetical protein NDU88_003561 [Pleurodeles waltl]|uniref:Uncharacterized protein n=1 Tax=Pleurodeles waltl TaxID=8319 RepID=A0AAV7KYT8_PLEWA|nr:hypothetical protein NDU88_003561 [Pleurodeles waltl]